MNKEELEFQGENPDEKVLFALRRHAWKLMHSGIWVVGWLLTVTYFILHFQGSWVTSWAIFIILPLVLYITSRAWFLWSNTVYILTNERIIVVNQNGWFHRIVKELLLKDMMTISHDIQGPIATMLNYGDVNIQASGASEKDLILSFIYDPYEIQQRIVQAKRGETKKENTSN